MDYYEIKEFREWAKQQDISRIAEANINADLEGLIESSMGNTVGVEESEKLSCAKATFEMFLDDLSSTASSFGYKGGAAQ